MGLLRNLGAFLTGSNDTDELTERILMQSAGDVVERAPAPLGLSVLNSPFLRGGDDFGQGGNVKTLRRPYEQSAWVMRAIKHVADPIASVPLRFAVPTADGAKQLIDPDIASFWERPAIGPEGPLSRSDVVEATVGWMKLAGECFWVFDDTWLMPTPSKAPFIIVRPDQMREVVTADGGRLLGWHFRDASGRDFPLLPEQVVHPKFWNPYHAVRGLPEWLAAKTAAESDAFAGEFVKNLMAANGDRGPVISSKGVINDGQRDQIISMLKSKKEAAARGQMQPAFLTADVEVHDPQISKPDSDFVAQRIESRKEIYLAFGVPASLAEPQAQYSIGAASDRYILIEDTCKPLAAKIAGSVALVTMRLKRMPLNKAAHLLAYFDFEQHSVMLEARTARVDTAMKLWGVGMPFADINSYLNLQAPSFDGDDVGFLPLAIETVETALAASGKPPAKPALPPSDPPEDEDDPTDKMLRLLSVKLPDAFELALRAPVNGSDPEKEKADREAEEAAKVEAQRAHLWKMHTTKRRPTEKMMLKAVNRAVFAARSEVLRKIEASTFKRTPGEAVTKDDKTDDRPHPGAAVDVMFDPVNFATELTAAVAKVAKTAMQTAGDELRGELGIDDPWTMPPAAVLNALRDRDNLLRNASQDVFDEVRAELEEGFKAGETTAQLADRARAVFNEISTGRANTIAITETGAAYGAGRQESATAAGLKTKTWLSARDPRVRPDHRAADGQTVNAASSFVVGGEQTAYPCGDGLSAAQACNCRCISIFNP